jgi:hypothetical protein
MGVHSIQIQNKMRTKNKGSDVQDMLYEVFLWKLRA